MSFLTVSNAEVKFGAEKFIWNSYIFIQALPTTRRVERIDKYEFVKTASNKYSELFTMHIIVLEVLKLAILIYLSKVSMLTIL